MVLDASTCINMYCNIERNIMKNQAGSPGLENLYPGLKRFQVFLASEHNTDATKNFVD